MQASLKEIQSFGLGILDDVVDVCDRHGIRYDLMFGTLLGAVHHGGFIPWDNDIDIIMPLKDYRRFLKIAKKELPDRYFIQNYSEDPQFNDMYTKIRVNHTTSLPVRWKKFKIHFGIGIDVFPVIGIYDNPLAAKLQDKLLGFQRAVIGKDFADATGDETWKKSRLLRMIYRFPRTFRHLICNICSLYVMRPPEHCEEIAAISTFLEEYSREKYLPERRMKFEGKEYRVPEEYDYILTMKYGDYMALPPESERSGHEGKLGPIIYDLETDFSYYQEKEGSCEN